MCCFGVGWFSTHLQQVMTLHACKLLKRIFKPLGAYFAQQYFLTSIPTLQEKVMMVLRLQKPFFHASSQATCIISNLHFQTFQTFQLCCFF
jgi:hypothetical protein